LQFERVAPELASPPFRLGCVYVRIGEDRLAPFLDAVALAHPMVDIGSYPRFDAADHRVRVTLEAKDPAAVEAALRALVERLPEGCLVRTEGP
jgi:molybdopterin-biosynthesis enzyme MoeA-like protein